MGGHRSTQIRRKMLGSALQADPPTKSKLEAHSPPHSEATHQSRPPRMRTLARNKASPWTVSWSVLQESEFSFAHKVPIIHDGQTVEATSERMDENNQQDSGVPNWNSLDRSNWSCRWFPRIWQPHHAKSQCRWHKELEAYTQYQKNCKQLRVDS
jgi:hypothetical protein